MAGGSVASRNRPTGEVHASWRDDDVLVAVMRGHQDASTIASLVELVRARLRERRARTVLFDAMGIEGFSPDVRHPGLELLRLIKSSDVPRCVAAASSGGVRMMGTAIAFAAGLPLEFVDSRASAERRIDEILRGAT